MARCVAFDFAQLFSGIEKLTPRGIDRVDLAYARHFLERWRGDCVAVLPTPWGVRWFERERALRAVAFIERHWGESERQDGGEALQAVKCRLGGEQAPASSFRPPAAPARVARAFARFVRREGVASGRAIRSLPDAALYLNTGQVMLGFPRYLTWLDHRPDVEPVFMLHDVIPLETPEYCRPSATALHRRALETTARRAARVIVTTEAAKASIRRELEPLQARPIAMLAAPLPVPDAFLRPAPPDPELGAVPYFVVCGTIEPRKNHVLLLTLWRELARSEGERCPKLVVVGSRSKLGSAAADVLDRCEAIRDHVIEVSGLPTPALRQLIAGARALLMPSFAEGFGLPIVEALALGTPVIASDLPSHREAGGSRATYLDPIDGLGWIAAVRAHAVEGRPRHHTAAATKAWTYEAYFRRVEPFVAGNV